ncbi:hypothetical protein HY498_03675 [Candidatus Woesearchaeota archaeon]|nr:hypothetical protein [Candidatus Woesearchaeota archaeon]
MVKEQEYAIKRINEWYTSLFRNNCTPEMVGNLRFRVQERLGQEGIKTLEELFGEDIFGMIDFNYLQRLYESNPFSKMYTMLDGSMQHLSLGSDMIPEGVKNEYIQPTIDSLTKVRDLLDKIVIGVRKKVDDKFPEELTDDDIRKAFMCSVGSLDNYCRVSMVSMDSLLLSLSFATIRGNINQEQYQHVVELFNAIKEEMPSFTKVLFG